MIGGGMGWETVYGQLHIPTYPMFWSGGFTAYQSQELLLFWMVSCNKGKQSLTVNLGGNFSAMTPMPSVSEKPLFVPSYIVAFFKKNIQLELELNITGIKPKELFCKRKKLLQGWFLPPPSPLIHLICQYSIVIMAKYHHGFHAEFFLETMRYSSRVFKATFVSHAQTTMQFFRLCFIVSWLKGIILQKVKDGTKN